MDIAVFTTVIAAFDSLVTSQPTRPLLTFYDDALGERTELSAATLANWVAKTANMLVDASGLGAGDTAAIRLPAHWQSAAVLLGCWTAGLAVDLGPDGTPAAAAFVSADQAELAERAQLAGAGETYALALAPLAAPFRNGPPPGTLDYVVQVRTHGDRFVPQVPVQASRLALADGTTHGQLLAAAASRGAPRHARLLIDGDARPHPVDWLLAPLVVGSSVVLCRNLDPAALERRLAGEHAVAW
jgi:uncharacterized protein (TIGR03089 family)